MKGFDIHECYGCKRKVAHFLLRKDRMGRLYCSDCQLEKEKLDQFKRLEQGEKIEVR